MTRPLGDGKKMCPIFGKMRVERYLFKKKLKGDPAYLLGTKLQSWQPTWRLKGRLFTRLSDNSEEMRPLFGSQILHSRERIFPKELIDERQRIVEDRKALQDAWLQAPVEASKVLFHSV